MPLVLTFSNHVLLKKQILFVKSLMLHVSIDSQFDDFATCSKCLPVCHSREKFVFDSCLRALYGEKILRVKSNLWSSQEKIIQIDSHSECLFVWKNFVNVSTVHK